MHDFSQLEKKLNLKFKNKDLLTQAFIHRSYLNESPNFRISHNERLEFLGDAVLEQIVTEYLFEAFPQKPEGELTSLRAALVNAKMLAKIASLLGFNDFLLLSQGEQREMGKSRQYILANAFEAFIGALYLDRGMKVCGKFIKEYLIKELSDIIKNNLYKDAKSKFQEEAQEKEEVTPSYKVLSELGPDHERSFIVGVFLRDKLIGEGKGSSKQEAEEEAAKQALSKKGWN